MTRSLEEASATLDVRHGDGAASMEERWRGVLGTSSVDAAVLRRMTVRQNSLVRCTLHASACLRADSNPAP